jgi:hypothetical protein
VANVLADGRVGAGSTAGGVIVHELTAEDVAAGREVRRFPCSTGLTRWSRGIRWSPGGRVREPRA